MVSFSSEEKYILTRKNSSKELLTVVLLRKLTNVLLRQASQTSHRQPVLFFKSGIPPTGVSKGPWPVTQLILKQAVWLRQGNNICRVGQIPGLKEILTSRTLNEAISLWLRVFVASITNQSCPSSENAAQIIVQKRLSRQNHWNFDHTIIWLDTVKRKTKTKGKSRRMVMVFHFQKEKANSASMIKCILESPHVFNCRCCPETTEQTKPLKFRSHQKLSDLIL